MRIIALLLVLPAALFAQKSQSSTAVYDINGHRVDWSKSQSGEGRTAQTQRDLNGRVVPMEKVEEKVLKNEGGVRVVERTVQRYDMNGNRLPPEKVVTETETRPDGSAVEKATVYRGDLNGKMVPAERRLSETRKSGDTAVTETQVERNTINGGFEQVEKRVAQERTDKTSSEREETVYTRNNNGRFDESGRTVVRQKVENGVTSEQVDEYNSVTGELKLARQTVSKVVKEPDGTERREVELFGPTAAGRAIPDSGAMQLREKQILTSKQSADGNVVQVYSIQRPSLNSTKELGPVQKISETVCQGKCQ